MAERWVEIEDEFYEGKHGRCEDPLDFEVRASKRIAELEAEVERLREAIDDVTTEAGALSNVYDPVAYPVVRDWMKRLRKALEGEA